MWNRVDFSAFRFHERHGWWSWIVCQQPENSHAIDITRAQKQYSPLVPTRSNAALFI